MPAFVANNPVHSRPELRGSGHRKAGFVWALLLAAFACVPACSAQRAGRGDACTRSAQCAAGLACVEGECSGDIDALGRQGDVPMLMPDAAIDAAEGADATTDDDAG
jgi:hypothetical protein